MESKKELEEYLKNLKKKKKEDEDIKKLKKEIEVLREKPVYIKVLNSILKLFLISGKMFIKFGEYNYKKRK